MRTPIQFLAVVTTLSVSVVSSSFGLGFRNPDQDARATGQGEAFVAQADAPSAVYYNPGGLTQLQGTEVSGGGFVTFRDIKLSGADGHAELNDPAYTAHDYMATDFGLERWRFGLGVNIPFGNAQDWGDHTPFRYQVTKSSLKVFNYELATAYKFNDHFSLGAGMNFYDSSTALERLVPFSLLFPGATDGRFKFDGRGQAFGATAGLLWAINDQNSVGVVYRSPFAIDYHGHVVVRKDVTGSFGRSAGTAQIDFPQSAAIGYAFRPNKKLKLEVDAEWTDWDTLNTVQLHSPNAAFATDPGAHIPFKWQSSWFLEGGAQYTLDKHWTVRGGYIFSQNTVPDSTFSPTLPDSHRHVFSAGVGYAIGHINIDVVYQYSLSEDRTIRHSADANFDGTGDLNGKWKSDAHAIMITSTFKF
jgi:long-chain fatty acid transport protein